MIEAYKGIKKDGERMMKSMRKMKIAALLIAVLIMSGCATVYLAPNGQAIANQHKTIAILPPVVSIKNVPNISADVLKEEQKTESLVFQQEIYKYLLQGKSSGHILVNIQEIESTNAILARNDIDLTRMTTGEICELLQVDGLLTSQFSLTKPMSTGAAIALLFLTGNGASTNEVILSLSLKDCESKSLIWKYDHKNSGGLLSSPSRLVENLVNDATKKLPYYSH